MGTFEKYKQNPGINASSLKLISISPRAFKKAENKIEIEKPHFTLGKAVDVWLSSGKEAFIKEFYIPSINPPSGMLYTFAKYIMEGKSSQEAYILTGYKPSSIKRETVDKNLLAFKYWMEEAVNYRDKLMLSPRDFLLIQDRVEEVLNNKYSSKIFKDFTSQIPLYWEEIMGNSFIPCKALPDIIQEFDDKILITDIKTTSEGVLGFRKTILKYRYDLQASWYCNAVYQCLHKPPEFQFLVVDLSEEREPPTIIKLSNKVIKDSELGFEAKNGYEYKGWRELLANYYWHLVNNKWEYSEEVYHNDGKQIIDQL